MAVYLCTHTKAPKHICTDKQVHVDCAQSPVYTHTHVHTHKGIHTDGHVHTDPGIHTPAPKRLLGRRIESGIVPVGCGSWTTPWTPEASRGVSEGPQQILAEWLL